MKYLIIAGGREFSDYDLLVRACNYYLRNARKSHKITVVCGGARGADALGKRYADDNNMPVLMMHADWNTYGKSAGYKRNAQMARKGDYLIAFWDGESKGTSHMIDLAKEQSLKVAVVKYKVEYNEIT